MKKGNNIYTLEDALFSKVRFNIPDDTVHTILIERALDGSMAYADANRDDVRLAYADILKWLVLGPSKKNNTSDSDNGWSHTEGGFEISERDRAELKAEANAIYAELEPSSMLKKKSSFRITSHGLVVWKDEFLKEHPELENFDVYTTKNGLEFKARDPETINVINPVRVEKKLAGATWAIDKIMAQIGIGDALRQVFKKRNKCFKLASVIEYMLIQRTNVMHGYAPFSKIHWLPWAYPLNDTQLNTLFKGITQDDTMALFKALNREYRRKFGDEFFQKMFLALDSTSISTYSKKLSYAEYGHNKDGDDTKQINFLLVCEESSGLPIYGKIYKGNVVDVSTVKNLLADLALVTGVSEDEASNNYIFVTDRGYESDDNLQDFARHNYSFVMRSRMANRWILDEVDDAILELRNSNNFDNYLNQTCCTKKVVYKYDPFPVNGKNKSNTAKLDLFLHMFFNEDICKFRTNGVFFSCFEIHFFALNGVNFFVF